MNRESREHWINEILNEVFLAVIAWEPLRNALIFKGARILNLHLGEASPAFRSSPRFSGNLFALISVTSFSPVLVLEAAFFGSLGHSRATFRTTELAGRDFLKAQSSVFTRINRTIRNEQTGEANIFRKATAMARQQLAIIHEHTKGARLRLNNGELSGQRPQWWGAFFHAASTSLSSSSSLGSCSPNS